MKVSKLREGGYIGDYIEECCRDYYGWMLAVNT